MLLHKRKLLHFVPCFQCWPICSFSLNFSNAKLLSASIAQIHVMCVCLGMHTVEKLNKSPERWLIIFTFAAYASSGSVNTGSPFKPLHCWPSGQILFQAHFTRECTYISWFSIIRTCTWKSSSNEATFSNFLKHFSLVWNISCNTRHKWVFTK